jgi:hypothetical protein
VLEKDPRFKLLMANTQEERGFPQLRRRQEKYEAESRQLEEAGRRSQGSRQAFHRRAPAAPEAAAAWQRPPRQHLQRRLLPTIGYGIKGAIWYQGESNAGRAYEYASLFPFMIQNWRNEWKQGDFSFYWVQLADFMAEKTDAEQATASQWAELRESQTKTQNAIKNGGQAVIIDLGEANDIHPKNKRDVAERLARWALVKDYGMKLPYRSPEFKSAEFSGGKGHRHARHLRQHAAHRRCQRGEGLRHLRRRQKMGLGQCEDHRQGQGRSQRPWPSPSPSPSATPGLTIPCAISSAPTACPSRPSAATTSRCSPSRSSHNPAVCVDFKFKGTTTRSCLFSVRTTLGELKARHPRKPFKQPHVEISTCGLDERPMVLKNQHPCGTTNIPMSSAAASGR